MTKKRAGRGEERYEIKVSCVHDDYPYHNAEISDDHQEKKA
jgi:hypothetical protein